jgi:hypothetical protein
MNEPEVNPDLGSEVRCWEYVDCPKSVREECPAFKDTAKNCWEIDKTQCDRIVGFPINCEKCRYYRAKMLDRPR